MCAMMPIFRNRFKSCLAIYLYAVRLDGVLVRRFSRTSPASKRLPLIMRERFIRIRHAMRVFLLLHGIAAIVRRVQQFCRKPISHCFLATPSGIENNPTDGEGAAA